MNDIAIPTALRNNRQYRRMNRIPRGLFNDPMFQQLSPVKPSAQSLLVWLIAGPYANGAPGVFNYGTLSMSEALGWGERTVRNMLKELINYGFVEYDSRYKLGFSEYILSFRYPETLTVSRHWARDIASLPRCPMRNKIATVVGAKLQKFSEKHYAVFVAEMGMTLPENLMRQRTAHVHIAPPDMAPIAPIKDERVPKPAEQGTGELYDEPIMIRLPCRESLVCEIRESQFLEWIEQFPLISVPQELEMIVRELNGTPAFVPTQKAAIFWVEKRLQMVSDQKKQSSVISDDLPPPPDEHTD